MNRKKHRIVAVLGPTNTGKTHFAMERMLAHSSGMIGFPLRLLARENYDRAVAIKGASQVALITGEEKIAPKGARYFLCTTEAMPVDREVAFLAVDEIQLCADADRGHIFTTRLLHARGTEETMFMGAETIRALLRKLIPDIEFVSRPRFSTLRYAGEKKIARLAPRSAVVAFSASDVYAIAEQLRRQRGGAAVIMGALSPRTRNAQVAMYQAGEVEHLVATDAIGMGLNMNVDHVAFASLRKFDGQRPRTLVAAELAQIAGRAGRHMNDGTFGVTAEAGPLLPETVEDIEQHRFPKLKLLYWRNPELDFSSLDSLACSLAMPPQQEGLVKSRQSDDEIVFSLLAADKDVAGLATGRDAVALLWQVCQVPDFRKVLSDAHASLLTRIYTHLMSGTPSNCILPNDWVANHVKQVDRIDGDIETLTGRLANIRTWTYIAHQGSWLEDSLHWQERTRQIEDRLSDALHESLTQRFVDKRAAGIVKRLKTDAAATVVVNRHGNVLADGHEVGKLTGFRYQPHNENGFDGAAEKTISAAIQRQLEMEVLNLIGKLENADDAEFSLETDATLKWNGNTVARLARGNEILKPDVVPLASSLLVSGTLERLKNRLKAWVTSYLKTTIEGLIHAHNAKLPPTARGIAFQLSENFGVLPRTGLQDQIKALHQDERQRLRRFGIIIGRQSVYMPELLKPAADPVKAILWSLWNHLDEPPTLPHPGRVSIPCNQYPKGFPNALGYVRAGDISVRADILERIAALVWQMAGKGPFAPTPEMLSMAGCSADEMDGVLRVLGFVKTRHKNQADEKPLYERSRKKPYKGKKKKTETAKKPPNKKSTRKKTARIDPDSPFAKLQELKFPK